MSKPREVLPAAKLEHSWTLHQRASKVMPAGVGGQSQYRLPYPIYIARARGSHLYDRDGNEYIDFMIGAGSLIHGHGHPAIMRAVREALEEGVPNLSATERQVELGRTPIEPGRQQVHRSEQHQRGFRRPRRPDRRRCEGGGAGAKNCEPRARRRHAPQRLSRLHRWHRLQAKVERPDWTVRPITPRQPGLRHGSPSRP